jgi:hypothetical protein
MSARDVWPPAIIGVGFALTAYWVIFLGYGLVRLVELAVHEVAHVAG